MSNIALKTLKLTEISEFLNVSNNLELIYHLCYGQPNSTESEILWNWPKTEKLYQEKRVNFPACTNLA